MSKEGPVRTRSLNFGRGKVKKSWAKRRWKDNVQPSRANLNFCNRKKPTLTEKGPAHGGRGGWFKKAWAIGKREKRKGDLTKQEKPKIDWMKEKKRTRVAIECEESYEPIKNAERKKRSNAGGGKENGSLTPARLRGGKLQHAKKEKSPGRQQKAQRSRRQEVAYSVECAPVPRIIVLKKKPAGKGRESGSGAVR